MIAFIDLKKQQQALAPRVRAAVDEVLAAGQYIGGPQVKRLEEELAAYVGVGSCVATSNGTSSMELALMAAGIGPGEAVFCPAFTFIATAEVAALRRARPVFVDIDPLTYNMSPQSLEHMIEKVKVEGRERPRAVISVDLFGLPADYRTLEAICRKHDLMLLEDAAQGFGGQYHGKRAGSFGWAGSTSFFPAKPLGCYGDGGALFTDDEALARELRSLRTHGAGAHKYEHVRLGRNSRLDTIQAAILLVKLAAFPGELDQRQRVAARYAKNLQGVVTLPTVPQGLVSSWAQYTVRVPAHRRVDIMARLKDDGVPTMIYYPAPLHLQPVFSHLNGRPGDLPEAEKAAEEVLSLPMHPYLEDGEIDQICQKFMAALNPA